MKKIPLTQNQYALVDDADYEWLSKHRWRVLGGRHTFYAERDIPIGEKQCTVFMHRLILGLIPGDGKETDHIDDNGLNNQRANLRICSTAENQRNQRAQRNVSSQYKGVSWHTRDKGWQAYISLGGHRKYLGLFTRELEAALAYNGAAKEHYGEYARLNNIEET